MLTDYVDAHQLGYNAYVGGLLKNSHGYVHVGLIKAYEEGWELARGERTLWRERKILTRAEADAIWNNAAAITTQFQGILAGLYYIQIQSVEPSDPQKPIEHVASISRLPDAREVDEPNVLEGVKFLHAYVNSDLQKVWRFITWTAFGGAMPSDL